MSTRHIEVNGAGLHDGLRITLDSYTPVHAIALFTRREDGTVTATLTAQRADALTDDELLAALAQLGIDLIRRAQQDET